MTLYKMVGEEGDPWDPVFLLRTKEATSELNREDLRRLKRMLDEVEIDDEEDHH